MTLLQTAQRFCSNAAAALRQAEAGDSVSFVEQVATALELARLDRTALPPGGHAPQPEWNAIVKSRNGGSTGLLLDELKELAPSLFWIDGSRFWPEPEHKAFADRLCGALIVGQDDATFNAEDRYIALLGLQIANATYPLHQHRIQEVYLVLSGHAEWSHDGENWTTLPPGAIFCNHPHEPHSMRTSDQPLLFASFYLPPFGWEGGLVTDVEN